MWRASSSAANSVASRTRSKTAASAPPISQEPAPPLGKAAVAAAAAAPPSAPPCTATHVTPERQTAAAHQQQLDTALREAQERQAEKYRSLTKDVDLRRLEQEEACDAQAAEEEAAVRAAQAERLHMQAACVWQLRMLVGVYDELPPGDLKLIKVMQRVATMWIPGLEVHNVADAYDALGQMLDLFHSTKLANESTPVARRAVLEYIMSCA